MYNYYYLYSYLNINNDDQSRLHICCSHDNVLSFVKLLASIVGNTSSLSDSLNAFEIVRCLF